MKIFCMMEDGSKMKNILYDKGKMKIFSLPGLCPWRAYVVTQALAPESVGVCRHQRPP